MCFSDILTSLSGRPPFAVVWLYFSWLPRWRDSFRALGGSTVWSPVHGPREPTSGYVKLLLPPRQSRGNSLVGLAGMQGSSLSSSADQSDFFPNERSLRPATGRSSSSLQCIASAEAHWPKLSLHLADSTWPHRRRSAHDGGHEGERRSDASAYRTSCREHDQYDAVDRTNPFDDSLALTATGLYLLA